MTDMENLEQKFEELSKHIPEYESDVWNAIDSLEKASSSAVENGKKKLEVAISRLNKVDELITSAFSMFPLSAKANARLQQCLVSVRPRLNSYIEQLKSLISNPPTESKYAKIDDIEIFSKEESQSSDTLSDYDNEQIDENNSNQIENGNIQSSEFNEQVVGDNVNQKIDQNDSNNNNKSDKDNSIKNNETQQNIPTEKNEANSIDTQKDDENHMNDK